MTCSWGSQAHYGYEDAGVRRLAEARDGWVA